MVPFSNAVACGLYSKRSYLTRNLPLQIHEVKPSLSGHSLNKPCAPWRRDSSMQVNIITPFSSSLIQHLRYVFRCNLSANHSSFKWPLYIHTGLIVFASNTIYTNTMHLLAHTQMPLRFVSFKRKGKHELSGIT